MVSRAARRRKKEATRRKRAEGWFPRWAPVFAGGGTPTLPSDFSPTAWWDNDPNFIFTDVAKTTNVASANDLAKVWEDKASAIDAIQSVDAAAPTWQPNVINGQAVVRADGVNDRLVAGDVPALELTEFVVFVVTRHLGSATARHAFAWQNTFSADRAGFDVDFETGNTVVFRRAGGAGSLQTTTTYTAGTAHVIQVELRGTSTKLLVDGILEKSGSMAAPDYASAQSINTGIFTCFIDGTVDNLFDGDVAEIIMYDASSFTDANRLLLQNNYLLPKYGLPPQP